MMEPEEDCGRPQDQPGLFTQALWVTLTAWSLSKRGWCHGRSKAGICVTGTLSASASKANPLPIPSCQLLCPLLVTGTAEPGAEFKVTKGE